MHFLQRGGHGMKRQIVRNLDTDHIPLDRLSALLQTFALKHAARELPEILERAELNQLSYRAFLLDLLETEVRGRNERRRKRNLSAAHFPPDPKPLNWIDTNANVVLAGPPGLGKTMLAVGLGMEAINSGYTVCFERMSNFVKILDNADTERSAGFRLKNIKKAQLVIIDEIGYTPISRAQANRFFTFISDTYETTSIIFTTNKEITEWAEMMGDPVLTTAMLDRILHHAACFSLRGQSYRLKHPEMFTT